MKLALVTVVLAMSLVLVAWRQGQALDALTALDQVRQERALAETERKSLERGIEKLESRDHVVPAARSRLRMRTAESTEIVILPGDAW